MSGDKQLLKRTLFLREHEYEFLKKIVKSHKYDYIPVRYSARDPEEVIEIQRLLFFLQRLGIIKVYRPVVFNPKLKEGMTEIRKKGDMEILHCRKIQYHMHKYYLVKLGIVMEKEDDSVKISG